jgi:ketosteroid isomerase-like protein
MKTRTLPIVAVISLAVASLYPGSAMAQSATEREVNELEQKMNAAYAANDLRTYFGYYSKDFTQWLPEGRTDLPQYEKMWTKFIKSGGAVESDEISDMHIQTGPSGDTAVASYLLHVKPVLQRERSPTRCFRSRMSGSSAMEPGRLPTCTIHTRPRKNSYFTLRSIYEWFL